MTNEQPQGSLESGRESPTIKPGHLLREARERKRLSIQAVAEHLHLRAQVVDYLEQDRYERLPPLTFVKGYLRAYAKLVDEPQERVMAAFAQLGLEAEAREPALPRGEPRRSGTAWLLGLAGLVLVLVAAFWLRSEQAERWLGDEATLAKDPPVTQGVGPAGGGEREPAAAPPSEAAPPPASSASPSLSPADEANAPTAGNDALAEGDLLEVPGDELLELPSGTADVSETDEPDEPDSAGTLERGAPAVDSSGAESAGEASAVPSPAPAVADTSRLEQAEPAPQPEDVLLVRIRGSSWMEVRDADGERVLYGTIEGPELFRFDGPFPYRLTIGDAGAVELEFRGDVVDLAPFTRGRVARLSLPPQR